MMKQSFLIPLFFLFLGTSFAQERPNILWINCDDLGAELGCYGNEDVSTPNMDQLASEGVRFTNAFSNAAVCSASRSSQITGCYPSTINCLYHRTVETSTLPGDVVPVMELFRASGYFCTNAWAHNMARNGKEDYNFIGKDFFDGTDWRQRAEGQPFFAQVQVHEPHRVFYHDEQRPIDPATVTLPTLYYDHPIIRADWALYLEFVQIADRRVGEILQRLEDDGLADNTIVFLFGDHGRPHLRDKQWLYDGGLHIPLIVRWPSHYKKASTDKQLISLVDVCASSLAAAGIELPHYMHGQDVLGGDERTYVYGFRDRCGDAPDNIRSVFDGRYRLIWNREPERPYMQLSSYKKAQYPAWSVYTVLHQRGQLPMPYAQLMADTRAEFELYDLKKDASEFNNLAGQAKYAKIQERLYQNLASNLAVWEKNTIRESQAAEQKAKEGSAAYFKKLMKKAGLPEDADEEVLLKHWEKEFGVE